MTKLSCLRVPIAILETHMPGSFEKTEAQGIMQPRLQARGTAQLRPGSPVKHTAGRQLSRSHWQLLSLRSVSLTEAPKAFKARAHSCLQSRAVRAADSRSPAGETASADASSSPPASAGPRSASSRLPQWARRWRQEGLVERIMSGVVSGGGAAALGSYSADPETWLHRLDPRVKQVWLLALVFLPARATPALRASLCVLLALLTVASLPRPIAKDQLLRSSLLSCLVFLGLVFATDGIPTFVQPRTLPHALEPLGAAPPSPSSSPSLLPLSSSFRFVLLQLGPLVVTRRALRLAATAAALCFILFQGAALSLTTTQPEATAGALRWFLRPLAPLGLSADAAALTLLLALRFLGLVFDEVRNLALGVIARGIQWQQLGALGSIDLIVSLAGRLFRNLFDHAAKISQAMVARGYRGQPSRHALFFLADFRPAAADWLALLLLLALCALTAALSLAAPA